VFVLFIGKDDAHRTANKQRIGKHHSSYR